MSSVSIPNSAQSRAIAASTTRKSIISPTALKKFGVHAALIAWTLFSVMPFVWAIIGSFQLQKDAVARTPRPIPAILATYSVPIAIGVGLLLLLLIGMQMRAHIIPMRPRHYVLLALIVGVVVAVLLAVPSFVDKRQLFTPTNDAYQELWLVDQPGNFETLSVILVLMIIGVVLLWTNISRIPLPRSIVFMMIALLIVGTLFVLPNFVRFAEFYKFFLNSIIVTVGTVAISISIGCLAGYGLARFAGIDGLIILLVALAFRALPRIAFILPFYFFAQRTGLYDTHFLLIIVLVAINQPFTIWMLRSFFMEIPRDLEEAAMIDGCGRLSAFVRIIVPVVWPGVITTSLFTVLLAYNEFLTARLLTSTNWTLPVAIARFTGGEDLRYIPLSNASAVSITIPIVIIVIFFQRYLVKGLVGGAVKG